MRQLAGSLAVLAACCCVATVLVAGGLATYLWLNGTLSAENARTILGVLRQAPDSLASVAPPIVSEADDHQSSYVERRAAREARELNLDLREQAVDRRRELVQSELHSLVADSQRWRHEKEAFERQLAELQATARGSGRDNLRLIWENIKPRQAKDQIVHMLAASNAHDVAAILLAMPVDKRAKIIGEFKTPEEIASLDEVLKAIRAGDPQASLINKTLGGPIDKARQ